MILIVEHFKIIFVYNVLIDTSKIFKVYANLLIHYVINIICKMEIVNLVLLALNFKIIDVKKIYKNYKILIVQIGLMDFVQNVH